MILFSWNVFNTKKDFSISIEIEKELINRYYRVPTKDNEHNAIHQTSANILERLERLSNTNNLKLYSIRKNLSEIGFPEKNHKNNGRDYMVVEQ